ncbi:MAG: ankyrin repeat domain-containing protein [Brevinema sp.]
MKKYISLILCFIIFGSVYPDNNILINWLEYLQEDRNDFALPKVPLLHAGVLSQDFSLINSALLYEPETINLVGACGHTPLHLAILKNNLEIIMLLIKEGAEINGVNNYGDTPLFTAVKNDSPLALIEYLMIRGADATMINRDDLSLLDLAEEYGRKDIQYYLFDKNIQKRAVLLTNVIDTTNMTQLTNLFTNTVDMTNVIDSSNIVEFLNIITRTNMIDQTNIVNQTNTIDITNVLAIPVQESDTPKEKEEVYIDPPETNNLPYQTNTFKFFEAV